MSEFSRDLFRGVINPHFASNMTTSFEFLGQHPGVNTEHTPFFVEGGDQRLPKQPLYYLSDSILESVQQSVGNLTTYWSHKNTFADGSCNGIGQDPVRAIYSPRSGDPIVLHEIPDLWQFCRTIGKGNHNNISNEALHVCFVDFKKAFDSVPRRLIWKRL